MTAGETDAVLRRMAEQMLEFQAEGFIVLETDDGEPITTVDELIAEVRREMAAQSCEVDETGEKGK
jgi:hypothetical protein